MQIVSIDFEFNKSNEKHPTLVSCALSYGKTKEFYWLHNNPFEQFLLKEKLTSLKDSTFVAFAVTSEARCFLALGLNPLDFKWIDLYLEYRCLLNHNSALSYGQQLIKGKIKYTKPPSNNYYKTEEEDDEEDKSKPEYGLSAACFKLLKVRIDTDRKEYVRGKIISAPQYFELFEQQEIKDYNLSDIEYLPQLLTVMINVYRKLLTNFPEYYKELPKEMMLRAEYACRTAIMESIGYPIDVNATLNFSCQVQDILNQCQGEINDLHPDIKAFEFQPRKNRFKMTQKNIRDWIGANFPKEKWMQTDGGKTGNKQFSLKKQAFNRYFNPRHEYKEDCFGEQMVRYLNLKQNLNGFLPGNKKNNFWDYYGSDGRVRSWFGIYGAQSARSQPKATGFIFLKSAWMRSLVSPRKGKAIGGIDYKSQEFLLAALLSGDNLMWDSYMSGDPYLHLAKLAGEVPEDGQRKDYEYIREKFKSTTLGLSYAMTKKGLALKLTNDLGRKVTEAEAQHLVDLFNRKYLKHYLWKNKFLQSYRTNKFVKLPCGWYMWGDNQNERSVGNVPVQGFASSIMRKAVALAQDRGLTVIKTLHDAIYIEYDSFDYGKIDILAKCMDEAFRFYFPDDVKPLASVGLEANTWSPDYTEGMGKTPGGLELKIQSKYLDKRGKKEYDKFKQYLTVPEFLL